MRVDHRVHELHPENAVFDRGKEIEPVDRDAVPAREHCIGGIGVDVGERLEEPLGMSGPEPRRPLRARREIAAAAREHPMRTVHRSQHELLRLLLDPLQARLLAEDADALAVEVSGRRHAHPHQSARAVGEAQLHVRVVVRLPAGDQRGELGRDVRHLQAGDEAGEVMGVRHREYPVSPTTADFPAMLGVVRQAACLCPLASRRVEAQPEACSTWTRRTAPRSPERIISRACRTIG